MADVGSYKTSDLIGEVRRRIENGSDIMKYHCLAGRRIRLLGTDGGDYYGYGVRLGSRRHLALKYDVSDHDLMYEIQRRILNGSANAFNQWSLFLKSGEAAPGYVFTWTWNASPNSHEGE